MAKKKDVWAEIKADFIAGMALTELAAKHGVSIAEILKHAKAEGWRRGGEAPSTLPVPVPAPRADPEAVAAVVEEAAQDIIREHRSRVRAHRDGFDELQAEFHTMICNLVSFLDAEKLEEIKKKPPAEAAKDLMAMLKAMAIKFGLFERLTNMLQALIDMERKVWGLNVTEDAPENATWDDLLAQVRTPIRTTALPGMVIDFERASKQRRERELQEPTK